MTSFINHDGRIITAENATKAQLRAMLADTEAEKNRLWDELERARADIRQLCEMRGDIPAFSIR